MKREIITIGQKGKVPIPTATPVWMSACEIASLFGVFSGKVNSHIKASQTEGDNSPATVFLHLLPGRVPFRLT